jgi:hypothetical protein
MLGSALSAPLMLSLNPRHSIEQKRLIRPSKAMRSETNLSQSNQSAVNASKVRWFSYRVERHLIFAELMPLHHWLLAHKYAQSRYSSQIECQREYYPSSDRLEIVSAELSGQHPWIDSTDAEIALEPIRSDDSFAAK